MKLQLALDELSLKDAMELSEELEDYIDIIEIGTPFVLREGIGVVEKFAKAFPQKEILADIKIMDAGEYESMIAYAAGAKYCTVLGVSDVSTIQDCHNTAKKYNGKSVVDLICVKDLEAKIIEFENIGIDVLAIHTGTDQQKLGRTPLDDLRDVKNFTKTSKIAVAGGISSKTIDRYVALKPDIIIVGSAICGNEDPLWEAKLIKSKMV
ncbi:MAG: 3-hexulose-6-phosphate synthase [Breznakia sp.]